MSNTALSIASTSGDVYKAKTLTHTTINENPTIQDLENFWSDDLNVTIKTIPHNDQRYETCGDYVADETGLREITVSKVNNTDYMFLVAIHEMIEQHLCLKRGISEESISNFDKKFEANRPAGNTDEPGNDRFAPYFKEHQFATKIEKLVADELGVNWKHYDTTINALIQEKTNV